MDINYKCHFCTECRGTGCLGELPGLGGFGGNINFKLNCAEWDVLAEKTVIKEALALKIKKNSNTGTELPTMRLAPITGAVENIGWPDEESYYDTMIKAAVKANLKLSIGDGCPDTKLQSGIKAVLDANKKAAVFIKPYPNDKIFERMEWANNVAEIFGVDIDSYNILTMRNKVHLEKKTATQLLELKKHSKRPFAVKGVFTQDDIELIKNLKPDIVYISNHGGRVENRIGSTADFLFENYKILLKNCGKLWIDGGIRKFRDIQIASLFGVSEVLVGRPFISALCKNKEDGISNKYKELYSR
ncbi:MAG: FMN-dependent dehydrogenase [Treponema sp. CETP13]|nr:MAG: FMN-dependent dehydrogenase [Treponema sp. CETP13]